MKKNKKLFDDKRIIFLFAVVLAVVSWVVIAGFINPGTSRLLPPVEIDYERDAQNYRSKNLQIVGEPPYAFADVQVQGDGAVIGPLNSESVTVYVDYGTVRGAGTFDLPLRYAQITAGNYNVSAVSVRGGDHSLESSPMEFVTLTFEEIETKEFTVTAKTENISAADGYFAEDPVVTPATVMVTGPKTKVEQIAQVQAVVQEEDALDERGLYTGVPLTLLDEAGEVLDSEEMGLTFGSATVDVDIQVKEIRTLPLAVEFTGMPQYFDAEWFNELVHLSVDELQVVGTSAAFENFSRIVIATFDISEMQLGWESDPVNIVLPEGLTNHDQLRQVTVSLDTTDMAEKTFEVPIDSSDVINGPMNTTISPVADTISVRLLGPEDQIDGLLPENIAVQIDAFSIQASRGGQQQIPVRVQVSTANRAIPMGSYSVVCDVTVE